MRVEFENILRKVENAGYQHFLLFRKYCITLERNNITLELYKTSKCAFKVEEQKIVFIM